jgi:hypothetical protein
MKRTKKYKQHTRIMNAFAGTVCPFPGCGEPIPARRFACSGHWDRIPAKLQLLLLDASYEFETGLISVQHLVDLRTKVLEEMKAKETTR